MPYEKKSKTIGDGYDLAVGYDFWIVCAGKICG